MSETNAAPIELLHHIVTVEGTYITRAGEETFSEKFIVPVENAEAALVHVLTRADDNLRARLLALDATFRGIRTHIVTAIENVMGIKPAPAVELEVPADPLAAANVELNEKLAKANAFADDLNKQLAEVLAEKAALAAQVATLIEDNKAAGEQIGALNEQLASLKADVLGENAKPAPDAPTPAAAPEAPAPQS